SLEIKNFRLLESFQVKKLGQVNLIVGKNNSGKSSVLEALRIYAGRANGLLLEKIALSHNEKYLLDEDEQDLFNTTLPFEDLFSGRVFPKNGAGILIGEIENPSSSLKIDRRFLAKKEISSIDEETGDKITRIMRQVVADKATLDDSVNDITDVLQITKNKKDFIVDLAASRFHRSRRKQNEILPLPCSVIPTQFISMDELAKEWDSIALTDGEVIVKKALQIVLPEFESLIFVDDYPRKSRGPNRQARVKITNLTRPVPLNSLGDGMVRILQLVLKVFSAKDGFLLIDEFENGLHYSVQEKVWKLLFELAKNLNIQIFATTHSWDCIESFSKIAIENKEIEGVLFRVGKSIRKSDKGRVISTIFNEGQLYNVTQSDVEVR
ncbi:MAG: AAA family ATPase, partial [Endozoicomonadaceae bacterium]|nr:AAA family ATPase [Endozoicomonadaceae bacterium]